MDGGLHHTHNLPLSTRGDTRSNGYADSKAIKIVTYPSAIILFVGKSSVNDNVTEYGIRITAHSAVVLACLYPEYSI